MNHSTDGLEALLRFRIQTVQLSRFSVFNKVDIPWWVGRREALVEVYLPDWCL
jgi:hypothetical protein